MSRVKEGNNGKQKAFIMTNEWNYLKWITHRIDFQINFTFPYLLDQYFFKQSITVTQYSAHLS